MKMKRTADSRKLSWIELLVSICSAGAFYLLVTGPYKNTILINTPLLLLLFLAGLHWGGKETWAQAVSGKTARFLLAAYSILNGWSFYALWITSSKVARIAQLLHIPGQFLVVGTTICLMVVSIPFLLRTVGLFLHFAGSTEVPGDQIRQEGCGGKKILLACFLVAAGTITVCSKSSFLYPLNNWVDANCFFTVGKSMMNGIVPYRDLFEQKGPFLYFLHGLAWLISDDSFLGVYLLEVIAATFFLYYTHRSVSLFVPEHTAYLMIPAAALVIYTSPAFCHGDSVEELCMPFLAYAVWVGFKALLTDSDISDREYLIIGICSGLVFWSKFILVGFYIGWFVVPAVLLLKKKAYKQLFRAVGMVVAGVLISTIPFVIYFGIHNAIGDWLEVYLYDNLFLYSNLEGESSGILQNMKMGRKELLYDNRLYYILCIFGVLWFYLNRKDRPWKSLLSATFLTFLFGWTGSAFYLFGVLYLYRKKISRMALYMTSMLFFTFLFTYMGGQDHAYYAFVFSVFVPFGIMAVLDMLFVAIPETEKLMKGKLVPALCVVLSIAASFWLTPNRDMMGVKKSELPQYQFAQIIHQVESPSLLNYGFLDAGFYTAAGLLPNCKAFCKLNVPLEEMMLLQEKYVREGLCDFVVTGGKELEYEHYTLIAESSIIYEETMRTYYLYQLK